MKGFSPLRIGIDGFNLAMARGTGVATYARTLSRCLEQMGHHVDVLYGMDITRHMSPALREVMFFDRFGQDIPQRRTKLFSSRWWQNRRADFLGEEAVTIPISGRVEARSFINRLPACDRLLNVPFLFEKAAKRYRTLKRFTCLSIPNPPQIMHWTYPLPIYLKDSINIYTMHDLVPLRLPYTTLDDKGYYSRLIADLCKKADGICTVSEASRNDIISFHPEAAAKIHNTYQSVHPSQKVINLSSAQVEKEINGAFGLKNDSYFLFFGSFEPKKNIGRIIEGFLEADTKRKLVLVGAMAWKSEQEVRFLERGIQLNRIMKVDYLPDTLLGALIRGARAVLFPSLSEGFGLPILEAMALGTATLTSKEGALREVAGDNAVLVDPYDISAITSGIEQLDRDNELCRKLAHEGPFRAANFDMPNYARRLEAMYKKILHDNKS